jgi:hypothetical protein
MEKSQVDTIGTICQSLQSMASLLQDYVSDASRFRATPSIDSQVIDVDAESRSRFQLDFAVGLVKNSRGETSMMKVSAL